jgi:hypothetical protein
MKTPRRKPIEPDKKFAKMLKESRDSGIKCFADEITICPPVGNQTYWRLRASFRNIPRERKALDTLGDVNAAFLSLSAELESLRNGVEGLPEYSNHALAEVIENYILQGGPKSEWRGKTPKNRKEDFAHLIAIAKKEKLKCEDLNASQVRKYLKVATNSGKRAKGMLGVIRTFTKWGIGAGYFTTQQLESVSQVVWAPPAGKNYKTAPSRREQSKLHFGTEESAGGEVPTHEQIILLAKEVQKYYQHGEALIHVSANLGTRANETFIYTASAETFEKGLGNLVDLEEEIVRVNWQVGDVHGEKIDRVTKNNKFRSVVVPPVDNIETGFDVFGWLKNRCEEALIEQAEGRNPLALIFPSATGQTMNLDYFNASKMRKALDSLGWKMPGYRDAAGKERFMYRFTLHSLRDRYGTTAADEWGYTERQLLAQGSWADAETVRKFYLGTTDGTYESVKDLHKKSKPVLSVTTTPELS